MIELVVIIIILLALLLACVFGFYALYWLWSIPKYGRYIGPLSLIGVVLFAFYAFAPPKYFYTNILESHSGVAVKGKSNLIWSWASRPFEFPRLHTGRYIVAVIENTNFNSNAIKSSLVKMNDCVADSSPVQKYLKPGVEVRCWRDTKYTGQGINFFLLHAEAQGIVFYKYRGH